MKPKYKVCFTLFLFCFTLFLRQNSVEAANLHAIIVCDTQADTIGTSVEADLLRVQQEIVKISQNTGLETKLKIFQKNQVNDHILSYLDQQTVAADDVVFFFFSGHGYRTESKGANFWPNLYFTPIKRGVDFYQVTQSIVEKKPRLLIAIADCCNNILNEEYAPPLLKKSGLALRAQSKNYTKINYQHLFLKKKGVILVSSSEPGEFSWATKSGGLYTLAFFEALNKEVNASHLPEWSVILDNASLKVMRRDIGQTPQYELATH